MDYLYKLSKEQLVIYLRRDSRGYGAQAMYPGVKHVRNRYHAMRGRIFMKSYHTEDEAARAVYNEALRSSNGVLASWIVNTHHVRNMPSYAAQRFATLYLDAVKAMQPSFESTAIESKKKPNSTSSPPKKKPSSGATTLPTNALTAASAAAIATAPSSDPGQEEQLTGAQIDEGAEVRPATRINNSIRPSQSVVHQRYRPLTACMELEAQAPTAPMSWPHPHIHVNNIPAQQHLSKPTELNPETHEPPTTIALSSCQAASVLSSFKPTGPSRAPHVKLLSTPGSTVESSSAEDAAQANFVKFKLFNVEISVPAAPGHDGFKTTTPGESSVGVCNRLLLPPRKRCKFRGEAGPSASAFKLFNVDICVPAAAAPGPGHDGFKIDTQGESTVGVCNNRLILPPRKRCKFMGED